MRVGPLLCGVLFGACRPGGLETVDARLAFEAAALSDGWVGFPYDADVSLALLSHAPCARVVITVEGPATLDPGAARFEASERRALALHVAPLAAGDVDLALHAEGCAVVADVALHAVARPPPDCPGVACAPSHFEPRLGTCVVAPAPDGTPCADICLTGSACSGGACVGQPLACDDGDPCTLDACAAPLGCSHFSAADTCPAPPECRSACQGVDCPVRSATLLWEKPASAHANRLVADLHGTLYWLEDSSSGFAVVSYAPSGQLRWRRTHALLDDSFYELVVGDRLILVGTSAAYATYGLRTSDGELVWSQSLPPLARAPAPNDLVSTTGPAATRDGTLVFPISFVRAGGYAVALDAKTGVLAWKTQVGPDPLWFATAEGDSVLLSARDATVGLSAAGLPLFSSSRVAVVAANGLYLDHTGASASLTGAEAWRFGTPGEEPGVAGSTFGLRSLPGGVFELFSTGDGQRRAVVGGWGNLINELLTARDSVIFLRVTGAIPVAPLATYVSELTSEGAPGFTCSLGGLATSPADTLLGDQRLYVLACEQSDISRGPCTVSAWFLPGVRPASEGWTARDGNPGRTRRPLP